MKKFFIPLILTATLFPSCATILNGKQQSLTINAIDKNSNVYVNGVKVGTGKNVTAKLERDLQVKQITIKTEGYKDVSVVHYQTKRSPLNIMSWVPFGIFIYPIFLDSGYKAFDYEKEVSSKEKLLKIPVKTDSEKYLFVNNTAFDLKENDLTVKLVTRKNYEQNKLKKYRDVDANSDAIKFDNSIFTDELNNILVNYKYTDTTNSIFKSKQNSAFLSAIVKKINVKNVNEWECRKFMFFLESDIEIEWELLDVYGQSLAKKTISSTSGQFSIDYNKDNTVKMSVKDAISSSFLKFINDAKVRDLLKINKEKEAELPLLKLNKGALVSNLEEALKSTVTIKTKDGHGSGFAITNDGYLITNFHVVAKSKDSEITVIDNKGKEFKATIVRRNELFDLALLKIETNFEKHFGLVNEKNYSIGQDIYAIGTPKTIELGQSLNKGIVSGERTKESFTLIQIDASVNGGNSGGPLVNKEGVLIGVVNAKLSGVGVEGIGFSIPCSKISSALNIQQ